MRRRGQAPRETTFLVEQYLPEGREDELVQNVRRLRTLASQVDHVEPFRVVQTTIVPHDASVLCLIAGRSEEFVRSALEEAGFRVDRISEAIVDDAGSPTAD